MNFLDCENIKCAVCGHINEFMPESGYYIRNDENSLDSRPGGSAKYRFYGHLQICEKCHYVNTRLDQLIPYLDKNILKSKQYTSLFEDGMDAGIILYAGSKLYRSVNDHYNAAYCLLACSWICDDSNERQVADMFRNDAKVQLEQYLSLNPTDNDFSAILVDIYRRTQNFDKAYDLALEMLENTSDKSLRSLLLFQIGLCLKNDKDNHYLKEIKSSRHR